MNNMEIEKKFLMNNVPENLNDYGHFKLEQAYISTNPAIRVRKKQAGSDDNCRYTLTVKGSGMLSRQEFELELDKIQYENLLKKAEGNVITKCRYIIPLEQELTLELDVFDGAFKGLIMGEIEFPSEEAAKKYTPPSFFGREVTFDTHFHNSTMSAMSASEVSEFLSLID